MSTMFFCLKNPFQSKLSLIKNINLYNIPTLVFISIFSSIRSKKVFKFIWFISSFVYLHVAQQRRMLFVCACFTNSLPYQRIFLYFIPFYRVKNRNGVAENFYFHLIWIERVQLFPHRDFQRLTHTYKISLKFSSSGVTARGDITFASILHLNKLTLKIVVIKNLKPFSSLA